MSNPFADILRFNSHTGAFYWRVSPRFGINVGDLAGSLEKSGHRSIRIKRRKYKAHRLAWLFTYGVWPESSLDHVNGIADDNRIKNLRPASRSQNAANSKLSFINTSGFKGVSRLKNSGRFVARICKDNTIYNLGVFDDPDIAAISYQIAAEYFFGEFARAA